MLTTLWADIRVLSFRNYDVTGWYLKKEDGRRCWFRTGILMGTLTIRSEEARKDMTLRISVGKPYHRKLAQDRWSENRTWTWKVIRKDQDTEHHVQPHSLSNSGSICLMSQSASPPARRILSFSSGIFLRPLRFPFGLLFLLELLVSFLGTHIIQAQSLSFLLIGFDRHVDINLAL